MEREVCIDTSCFGYKVGWQLSERCSKSPEEGFKLDAQQNPQEGDWVFDIFFENLVGKLVYLFCFAFSENFSFPAVVSDR